MSKFSPHGVQHHFGQRAKARVVVDLVVLRSNPLEGFESVNISLTLFDGITTRRPTAGFDVEFQPDVDVALEHASTMLGKMPDLLNSRNDASECHKGEQLSLRRRNDV